MWPWASRFPSVSLSFPIHKARVGMRHRVAGKVRITLWDLPSTVLTAGLRQCQPSRMVPAPPLPASPPLFPPGAQPLRSPLRGRRERRLREGAQSGQSGRSLRLRALRSAPRSEAHQQPPVARCRASTFSERSMVDAASSAARCLCRSSSGRRRSRVSKTARNSLSQALSP